FQQFSCKRFLNCARFVLDYFQKALLQKLLLFSNGIVGIWVFKFMAWDRLRKAGDGDGIATEEHAISSKSHLFGDHPIHTLVFVSVYKLRVEQPRFLRRLISCNTALKQLSCPLSEREARLQAAGGYARCYRQRGPLPKTHTAHPIQPLLIVYRCTCSL